MRIKIFFQKPWQPLNIFPFFIVISLSIDLRINLSRVFLHVERKTLRTKWSGCLLYVVSGSITRRADQCAQQIVGYRESFSFTPRRLRSLSTSGPTHRKTLVICNFRITDPANFYKRFFKFRSYKTIYFTTIF